MAKDYFNRHEYVKIINMIEYDVFAARDMVEKYIEQYPLDYSAYCVYANTLVETGRFKEAEEILELAEYKSKRQKKYIESSRSKLFYKDLVFARMRIFAHTGRLYQFLDACGDNKEILLDANINLSLAITCFAHETDLTRKNRDEVFGYTAKQYIEYREEELKRNIIELHSEAGISEDNNRLTGMFYRDFPLDEVIEEVKKYIPSDKVHYDGMVNNAYYFRYDSNGKCAGNRDRNKTKTYNKDEIRLQDTNYFKVLVFEKNNKIFDIYPCENTKGFEYVDLNYLKEKTEPKAEKKDKVALFYKKYPNIINR